MTAPSTGVSRADLHIHTMASDGTASVSQVLARAEEVGLDIIAITDHDRIDAAEAAKQMAIANNLRVQVVVGEEISTLQGHLLGLFLRERVRPLRSLRRTIAEVHEQGGIAIPAHPLFPHPLCAQEGAIRAAATDRDPACRPDGLETYNPTIFGTSPRRRVARLAADLGLATLGSSDAHVLSAIGRVWTTFPGSSPEALREAPDIGNAFRVSSLVKGGAEAVGGVVVARSGANAQAVIDAVKAFRRSS